MNLESLRKEIDGINEEIIALLAKRLNAAKQIAEVKRAHTLPVDDWEREKLQNERLRELAKLHNMSPAVIEDVFNLFVSYSKLEMKLIMLEGKT